MKQIVKIAEKIMKELKACTGWDLVGGVKGNNCSIRADVTNESGKKIRVLLDIVATDVHIQAVGLEGDFDEKSAELAHERLEFPVETQLEKGDIFTISYHEPLGVLEHSVKGVLNECIMPMVRLLDEMIES